jgi:SAM-dependent methyltransferase
MLERPNDFHSRANSGKLFDGVVMVATLCFVSDPSLALRECGRVLHDDGTLVLAIIPADSPWGRLYAEKGKAGHAFYSTATFHTCNEVIRPANAAGFTLAQACSCLLSRPDQSLAETIREGVVNEAGFVSMRFSRARG